MYRRRGRAANDKQISRDNQTAAVAIIGYVFLMAIITAATGSMLPAVIISVVFCLAN